MAGENPPVLLNLHVQGQSNIQNVTVLVQYLSWDIHSSLEAEERGWRRWFHRTTSRTTG